MDVESICLIVKENKEKTAMVWFPPVRDFIEISSNKLKNESYLGKFFRLSFPVV